MDRVEFYNAVTDKIVASVESSIVPKADSHISIRKVVWRVLSVTYALDNTDPGEQPRMRANVDLVMVKP